MDFIQQGTIVDRIDYNIQNVAASVEEGFKQLEKVQLPIYIILGMNIGLPVTSYRSIILIQAPSFYC